MSGPIDSLGNILRPAPQVVVLSASQTNSTSTMQPITALSISLEIGFYRVEFTPHYNVNATTTGTGWNFQAGTAVISNYSFRSILPSTATASYINNYAARNQNFATAQTSRVNNNRGTIIAEFEVSNAGTIVPCFRSEVSGGLVTLLPGSVIVASKL